MTMHLRMHTLYTHNTHIHIHMVLDRRWDFILGPGLCLSFLAKTAPERLTEGENFIGKVVVVGQAAAHLKQTTVVCILRKTLLYLKVFNCLQPEWLLSPGMQVPYPSTLNLI